MLMEPNGLGGGVYGGIGPGMLGLEMPLHQQQNPANAPNPHSLHHPQLVPYAHHEADHHSQSQPPAKPGYAYAAKSKQQLTLSDDDEAGFNADDGAGDGKRKASSPWQRMKWTDTMVKILIMAVLYIGDEGGSESNDPKKKPAGLLQKKGKWKSVSRAMMEKGFYVSPQQCEDKFNDLNKRYKRVNDILGKGTACRVVENQSLLEMMDLSPKMKEEVKKLLNSKHLFFREMCAYHSSCSHGPGGSGGASGTQPSPEVAVEPSHIQQQVVPQRGCFHSTGSAAGDHLGKAETEASKMVKGGSCEEESDEDEDEDSEDEDDDESDDEVGEGGSRGHSGPGHEDEHDYNEPHKRPRKCLISLSTALVQQLSGEATSVMQDGNRSPWEKKQWMKAKLLQLEEQQVSYQLQAFELEKQRLKWVKFSGKKEREMERAKLENERRRLENERMVLLVRQKELELLDLQQQQQQHSSNKRSEPSSITG